MATQAVQRQLARAKVRIIKRSLRTVDTSLEVMERRLNKILETERLVTTASFDSFLKNMDKFYVRVRSFETTVILVMTVMLGQ